MQLVRLITVADWVARESERREAGPGDQRTLPDALAAAATEFSVSDADLAELCARIVAEVREAELVMGAPAAAGARRDESGGDNMLKSSRPLPMNRGTR